MSVRDLTIEFASDPSSVEANFALAESYNNQMQYASAAGFYLRAAEYGYKTHPLIAYTSLLKMSLCFSHQGDRTKTVYTNTVQAITLLPTRPEAYFLLARIHERSSEYIQCYMYAEMGLLYATATHNQPLPGYVEYNGPYCLMFEKAVAGWWIGRKDESKALFNNLLDNYDLSPEYLNGCLNNLRLF